ncbi:MAG: sigma-70 family RNA polymerase sigma factor [Blastopirellula sp. JB062]
MGTSTVKRQLENRTPDESELYEQFLRHFMRDQNRVFAYILALVRVRGDADDIFQETSLILWREFGNFQPDKEFLPWGLGIAKNQILKYWRSRKSDRHLFSDELVEQLAADAIQVVLETPPRKTALRRCLQKLTERQRQLIELFYGKRIEAAEIAASWNRSVFAVYKALKVVRRNLLECIENQLVTDQAD